MSADSQWYVAINGQQQGPLSLQDIHAGIREGRIGQDAHVFTQGMDAWAPITTQAELAQAFGGGPAVPTPPAQGAGPGPSVGSSTGPSGSAVPPQVAHEIDYEIFGAEMQYVEITLDPREACIAEAGAFMYMDPGIEM